MAKTKRDPAASATHAAVDSVSSPPALAALIPPVPPPDLRFGWLLDYPTKVAVNLDRKGLQSHTAIIAQSGSGKSFALGRLLEEIASKTKARILILDPNSDFVKFSEVAEDRWDDDKYKTALIQGDTREECKRRWNEVGFQVLTGREPGALGLKHTAAQIGSISLSWASLGREQQLRLLEVNARTNPEELLVYDNVALQEKDLPEDKGPWTFDRFQNLCASLCAVLVDHTLACAEWPLPSFAELRGVVSIGAARNLWGSALHLARSDVWEKGSADGWLQNRLTGWLAKGSKKRVACLDIGSFPDADARFLAANVALRQVWAHAIDDWIVAMGKPAKDDDRCPVFVVIDEAHNLAPAGPTTPLAKETNEILVRMATEGRKFGISLILVTQRPHRLDASLLSQCDNLCLLKMNNLADLQLVEQGFGFLPPGMARRALDFKVGQALLAGNFVPAPTWTQIAPRRTAEGGRNLEATFWGQDPAPLA